MATVEAPAQTAVVPPLERVVRAPTEAPPIAADTHAAQPPNAGIPTPIPQAKLDSAFGEGPSLTEAAARVRKVTQAAYGMVTSLLDGEALNPNATVQTILEKIKAKNPDRSFHNTELEAEITLALEEAKILSQEKQPLPVARESTLPVESIEEINTRIKIAWAGDDKSRGAVQLLIAAAEGNVWDESQVKFLSVAGRLKYMVVVVAEAKEAVKKKLEKAARKADIKRVSDGQNPMDEKEKASFFEQYKKKHQAELTDLESQYFEFDRQTGTYTLKIGLDRRPLQQSQFEKISTFSNVPDAMDALRDLATHTDANGKPTTEALEAKGVLATLEKYLNEKGDGFEPLTDVEKAGKRVVTTTYKLLDALLEPFGQKLEYITDGKPPRRRIKLEALEKIDSSGEMGSRLSRMAILLTQYEDVNISKHPDAQAYLAAMIYDETAQIDISRITSANHPGLAKEFQELSNHGGILHQYRDKLLEKVKGAIYQYYYPGEPLDLEKLQKIALSGPHLFRILYFANACEGHVGINPDTKELDMEAPLKGVLNKSKIAGEIFDSDILAIMRLAGSKQAGTILKNELGFDPERLKDQPITAYANRVIAGIDAKRPDDKKMTEKEKENYYKVFEEIQTLGEEASRGSGLGGWIKALGMLALILGPSVFKIFDEGVDAGQGQQAPSG
ncbi:hypothetical protein HY338_04085 [Candidatus Gottesmanbacteria bacterium]|nr:hypothetical protein [Candidatus Gottesmanbacteria bacterium]